MIEKLKSLSKDTLIYGINTIIGRFLNFILVPYYTNKFLPEEYGIIALIYSYIALLNIFFSAGLESGYMRFAAMNDYGSGKENFSNPYVLNILNAFALGTLLYFFAEPLAEIFQIGTQNAYLLKYAAAILFLDAVVLIPFANLRINNKAARFVTLKVINIVINVILNVYLISVLDFGIEAVLISNLVSSAITFLMILPVAAGNWTFNWNRSLIKDLLKFSLPYIPTGIAASLIQVINRPILKSISDDSTVGIYQANYKLGIFMMLVVSMFEYAWRPFFLTNARESNAKEIFAKVLTAFVFVGCMIVLLISLFTEDIVKAELPFGFHLIGETYWSGLEIVPVVLLAYLFYGIYINFMAGIYIEKKTSYLPFVTIAGAAVNIAGIYLMYPVWGLIGVAAATLLSYIVMSAGIFYVSNKYYRVKYEFGKIFITITFMIMVYVLYLTAKEYASFPFYVKLVFPAIYLLLLSLFKVHDLSVVKRFMRSQESEK